MTPSKNAVRERMDRLRERNRAMADVSRLDACGDTTASALRGVLREARTASGLTMQQMADRLHVSQSTVSAIENGSGNLGLKTIARYLDALNVNLLQVVADLRQSVLANASEAETAEPAGEPDDGIEGSKDPAVKNPRRLP